MYKQVAAITDLTLLDKRVNGFSLLNVTVSVVGDDFSKPAHHFDGD